MPNSLDTNALEQTFLNARSFSKFTMEEVSDELIAQLYDLMKWGPTSMNCQPAHYLVIRSPEAKKRLIPTLMPGNQDRTSDAPATIIVATDMQFYEDMDAKVPAIPEARSMFVSNEILAQQTALRNSTLQGAYLIIAARMLGLDCGPMSGFNNDAVDAEFFPEGRYKSNFLINIGCGDPSSNYPRGSRLSFEQAVDIL